MRTSEPANRLRADVVGTPVDVLSWDDALRRVDQWAQARESRSVCFCSVHTAIRALADRRFADAMQQADLLAPDGGPIAWMLRQLGARDQARVNGPDFMWRYLGHAEARGARVYFLGSTPPVLDALCARVARTFPRLQIVGAYSPSFGGMLPNEEQEIVDRIHSADADIVFVGLGCPKQELWIARHRGVVRCPMVGVGAAFDFCSLRLRRAPPWMQSHSLEWLYRLLQEPRRLAWRYLLTNAPFVVLAGAQWLRSRLTGARPASSHGSQLPR